MSFDYAATEPEPYGVSIPADMSEGMPMDFCADDEVEGALLDWAEAVGSGKRYRYPFPDSSAHYVLKLKHWPGVLPEQWAAFKDAVRTSPPAPPPLDEAASEAACVAHDREWQARDPFGYAYWKRDPGGYYRGEHMSAAERQECDRIAARNRADTRRKWHALRRSISQPGWKSDWKPSPAQTGAPSPRPPAGARPSQQSSKDAKVYQQILRLAFNTVSPSGAWVSLETVRPKFVEAYPQGRDTDAKHSGAAVRKAWSRALKDPPHGIAIKGDTVSALAA